MFSILLSTWPLDVVIFVILIGGFLLTSICLKKRHELLKVLESDAPEFYQSLGAPSLTILQQLFRRRDCLANDRLCFYALFRADIFPDQPRVHAALVGYRRLQIFSLGFFALVLIVGGLFIYSVR
jgi:hypothetical protein